MLTTSLVTLALLAQTNGITVKEDPLYNEYDINYNPLAKVAYLNTTQAPYAAFQSCNNIADVPTEKLWEHQYPTPKLTN